MWFCLWTVEDFFVIFKRTVQKQTKTFYLFINFELLWLKAEKKD